MRRLPIKAARDLSDQYGLSHVILYARDHSGKYHVVTFGRSTEQAGEAADYGNQMKAYFGWPKNLCEAQPSRVRKLQAEIKALKEEIHRAIVPK